MLRVGRFQKNITKTIPQKWFRSKPIVAAAHSPPLVYLATLRNGQRSIMRRHFGPSGSRNELLARELCQRCPPTPLRQMPHNMALASPPGVRAFVLRPRVPPLLTCVQICTFAAERNRCSLIFYEYTCRAFLYLCFRTAFMLGKQRWRCSKWPRRPPTPRSRLGSLKLPPISKIKLVNFPHP
jgi:hypothetical protein